MSGHSKWATTKRKKSLLDTKRSANFTKLSNAITVAARTGKDPAANFTLRMAIDKAKSFSLPKENIERAIKRGTGKLDGNVLEQVVYEGFGPDKVAIIIECLTDNKNRTHSEIKHILANHNGSIGAPGSVMWNFERKGVITINNVQPENGAIKNLEEMELKIIDAGADDFILSENYEIIVFSKLEDLQKVKENLETQGFKIKAAGLEYVAKEKITLSKDDEEKLQNLLTALEEQGEVSAVYSNWA